MQSSSTGLSQSTRMATKCSVKDLYGGSTSPYCHRDPYQHTVSQKTRHSTHVDNFANNDQFSR